jgi:hypothetical protein
VAGADEILASVITLEGADGSFKHDESRSVELKGISGLMEVARVRWR